MNIKPIETEYKGIKFRSKLEAQWAVYFDACGADWEYEPEGFDCGDGVWYLPDFVIHNASYWYPGQGHSKKDLWIEVKGVMDWESVKKIKCFVYGDRETRIQNLEKDFYRHINDKQDDLTDNLFINCLPMRPLLIVGRMPTPGDLKPEYSWRSEEKFRVFDDWVGIHFAFWKDPCNQYFYKLKTVNGDSDITFPFKGLEGGLVVDEAHLFGLESHHDPQGTLDALYKARNYRFDHRYQK